MSLCFFLFRCKAVKKSCKNVKKLSTPYIIITFVCQLYANYEY